MVGFLLGERLSVKELKKTGRAIVVISISVVITFGSRIPNSAARIADIQYCWYWMSCVNLREYEGCIPAHRPPFDYRRQSF